MPTTAIGSSGRGREGRQGHRVVRQGFVWGSGTTIWRISSIAILAGSKSPRKGLWKGNGWAGAEGRSAPLEGGAEIDHRPGRPQSGQPGLTRSLTTAQSQMMDVKLCGVGIWYEPQDRAKKNMWVNVEEPATYRLNNAPGATLEMSTAGRDRARFSKPPRSWDSKDRIVLSPRVLQV